MVVDTRIQGQSIKKSSTKHKHKIKPQVIHGNYQYVQPHQPQIYYNPLSVGTNGAIYYPPPNAQLMQNNAPPFLPKISGASAFANYPTDAGYAVITNSKVR